MKAKTWNIKSPFPQDSKDRITEIVRILLENRGLNTPQDAEAFFHAGDLSAITLDKVGIDRKQVTKACKRLKIALEKQEKVIIYGDYDADGITSTAIIWETLHALGVQVFPFLPHREEHGYGLKPIGIDSLIEQYGKPDLIITVDNGIVAFEGATYCKEKGIDLIITDHHEPAKNAKKQEKKKTQDTVFPQALAVIHSTKTAGAGIAYFFAREVLQAFEKMDPKLDQGLLELATIGIVADMVPLLSLNRNLLQHGLSLLSKTQRPGLKTLLNQASVDLSKPLTTYHIGFMIAPRLNATGRLEHCLDSLRLLCTGNEERAMQLCIDLEALNRQRQDLTANNLFHATQLCENKTSQKLLITASEKYNPGVIGLVAGKLVERFYKPAIVISVMNGVAKASVRSVGGVNIIEFLRNFREDFIDLGGHPMAAGFSVSQDKLEEVIAKMETQALQSIPDEALVPVLTAETELEFSDLTLELYTQLQRFSPFGLGNPQPILVTRNVTISSINPVGKAGQHLKLVLTQENKDQINKALDGIFFSANSWVDELRIGQKIAIAYHLDLNEWNGSKKIQLVLKDIKTN